MAEGFTSLSVVNWKKLRSSLHAGAVVGVMAWLSIAAQSAKAVISLDAGPDGQGEVINILLGADTFYNNGYFGQNSVVSNVEAGAIWNGHESLTQVDTYISDPSITGTQLGSFDYHATAVGMAIAGQGQLFYYQAGMAPLATLWSGSIATQFNSDGTFNDTTQSFIYAYEQSMQVGRPVTINFGGFTITENRTADVINSSWGFADPGGDAFEAVALDALAMRNSVTVVVAAGNSGPGPNTVGAPASAYNNIAVAALAVDNTPNPYTTVSTFSSRGPNDFVIPAAPGSNAAPTVIPGVRPVVDIAAPGEDLVLAYYGGLTGSNTNGVLTGGVDTTGGANDFYLTSAAGTSFAAPLVAGGAALLADYAHVNFGSDGLDPRVIKAVLLNSADKTPGWNNGQAVNGQGVIETTQALDWAVGAGRMNLTRAYQQFSAGTTDLPNMAGGHVHSIGWALGQVLQGTPTDYVIDDTMSAGQSFTATLTWYVHRTLTDAPDPNDDTVSDDRFDNLFLEIWKADGSGDPTKEIASSDTLYDNLQHLSFTLPEDGQYMIEVVWAGQQYDYTTEGPGPISEDFGLAWSNVEVPEPSAIAIITCVAAFCLLGGRFRRFSCSNALLRIP